MNIQPFRSSFTVYVVDADEARARDITTHLENSGYRVTGFRDLESARAEFINQPPHILICGSLDPDAVEKLLVQLPELHILVVSDEENFDRDTQLYADGVYDVLIYPFKSARQLLRAVDRAAEADYQLYLNEQLKERIERRPDQFADSSFSFFEIWFQELFRKNDSGAAIEHFMREVSRHLGGAEVIYFRYVSARATLVAENSVGLEMRLLQNVGIELKSTETDFSEAALAKPHKLTGLTELIRNGFQRSHFLAFTIFAGREIRGVVVAMTKSENPLAARDPYLRLCLEALQQFERLSALKAKMRRTTMLDDETEVFAREFVIKKIREEISRSRRISKPVSLILLAIDGFQEFQLSRDAAEVTKLLRALAQLFMRHSRLNDLVGRAEMDQFVIILPHTDKRGASIKAERLRRMIESADFSKVLTKPASITVSVGVSEYPSVCNDADGLLQTAEEALYQVKRDGNNRVCLATPGARFVPDFVVKNEAK